MAATENGLHVKMNEMNPIIHYYDTGNTVYLLLQLLYITYDYVNIVLHVEFFQYFDSHKTYGIKVMHVNL